MHAATSSQAVVDDRVLQLAAQLAGLVARASDKNAGISYHLSAYSFQEMRRLTIQAVPDILGDVCLTNYQYTNAPIWFTAGYGEP